MEIRLKTGFFATERCELTVCNKKLLLTSGDLGEERVVIPEEELVSLCISAGDRKCPVFELCTRRGRFDGCFPASRELESFIGQLREQFHGKIKILWEEER